MYYLYLIFRIILYPFVRYILPLFSSKASRRLAFEQQNHVNIPLVKNARFAFQISSEGELEQVISIIYYILQNRDDCIELIFTSESVEKKCLEISQKYPQRIRLYRLPIMVFNPFSKVTNLNKFLTAQTIFLCRYDFFPELIQFSKKKKSILLSSSLKSFNKSNYFYKMYLKDCYESFDIIVAANNFEKTAFEQLFSNKNIQAFDFRAIQITNRLENAHNTLQENIKCHDKLVGILNNYSQRYILGSFWNYELNCFDRVEIPDDTIIGIAPHNLKEIDLTVLKNYLIKNDFNILEVNSDTTELELNPLKKNIILFNIKGVLCELYSLFDSAYISGGFGVGIHSVLEPGLANIKVYCGPEVYKSTEFDYVKNLTEFFPKIIEHKNDILKIMIADSSSDLISKNENFDINNNFDKIVIELLEV